jgi:hypothetical protein
MIVMRSLLPYTVQYSNYHNDRVIGVQSPAEAKDFPCSLCVQTNSEAYAVKMGTWGPFPGVKRGRGVMLTTHPHLVSK